MSSLLEHLRVIGPAHAVTVDLFGQPINEVVVGGRIENRGFNIKIKL